MQSYVSKLYLHIGKKKLVFFVDNGPWSAERSRRSKSVELWQLMVTQSRISPFANRSSRLVSIDTGSAHESHSRSANVSTNEKWSLKQRLFHKEQSRVGKLFRDLFQIRLRSVVNGQELLQLLNGCVTFELEWDNIRGINYLNDLQTDTCVALEIKLLVKRDFYNIKEALAFYGLEHREAFLTSMDLTMCRHFPQGRSLKGCNPGVSEESCSRTSHSDELSTDSRHQRVAEHPKSGNCHLSDSDCELFDAVSELDREIPDTDSSTPKIVRRGEFVEQEPDADFSNQFLDALLCSCMLYEREPKQIIVGSHSTCPCSQSPNEEGYLKESDVSPPDSPRSSSFADDSSLQDDDEEEDLFIYRDTLLMFRFCDPLLPLELREIITADQRLLKMLESGLPSWVIFLQSYPVFRKLYRPWMRPLARTMYILVSIITVIIGFYDLYKNVPVLKATAARLCGPFFEWIEAWEMVSRVKYLGTVLFLQNWEKAFRWLLLVFGTVRKLSNLILQPMVEPLQGFVELIWPAWILILDSVWGIIRLLWMMCSIVWEYSNFILQLVFVPFLWLLTAIESLVDWVLFPIFNALWGLILLPIRIIMLLVDSAISVMCNVYTAIQSYWILVNSSFQLFSAAGPQVERTASSSASTLRLLWNDIFSQVFRAVRSILNVFVVFFTTCNRHRLSTYNHIEAFFLQLRGFMKSVPSSVSKACHQGLETSLVGQDSFTDEGHKRSSRVSTLVEQSPRQRIRRKGSVSADK